MDQISASVRSALYKGHLLLPETPRLGDKAAVVKSHCVQITDLMVKVTNDPVYAEITCVFCGQNVKAWCTEVMMLDDMGREPPEGGEYLFAMPVKWMQRVLPIGHSDASQKQVLIA